VALVAEDLAHEIGIVFRTKFCMTFARWNSAVRALMPCVHPVSLLFARTHCESGTSRPDIPLLIARRHFCCASSPDRLGGSANVLLEHVRFGYYDAFEGIGVFARSRGGLAQ